MARRTAVWTGLIVALGVAAASDAAETGTVTRLTDPMTAEALFDFRNHDPEEDAAEQIAKLRLSASGIAFTRPGLAFIAFDEGAEARFASLTEDRFAPDAIPIPLRKDGEVDAEGAATDGKRLYVIGSHSAKRTDAGDCKAPKARRSLLRFELDPATGRPKANHDGDFEKPDKGDLLRVIRNVPELNGHVDECLADGAGLNIEGLALLDGALWFGLRGPTKDGEAFLLGVDAERIFDDSLIPAAELRSARVGAGRGVRDMESVDGGLLILAGTDDVKANTSAGWAFVFWNGSSSRLLGALDLGEFKPRTATGCVDKERKPEAVAVIDPKANPWRVVVLSDGLCDGGPMWFDVPH